jgi:carbamoyl-phosphate synthase large subunit
MPGSRYKCRTSLMLTGRSADIRSVMPRRNILISSAGRRVTLLACIRERSSGTVFTIDSGLTAPAAFVAGHAALVPRCTDPHFMPTVLRICAENDIGLLIPTIDTELPLYAAACDVFREAGTVVCISSPECVRICCDKVLTHQWLTSNRFPTVRQTAPETAADWPFPLIAKPCNGSSSIGLRRLQTRLELESLEPGYIVQEIAAGREFTINVYVNRAGECVSAVPHWRMEVRAGEVSKGLTVKDPRLVDLGRAVAEALPGAYGPLNIQCFMDDAGAIKVIEINARFGGGYPLAHRAGARFTDWLLDELEGKPVPRFDDWTDDLAMLRYDEAVFVPGKRIRA